MTAKDVILVLANSIYIVRCDQPCVTTLIPRDLVLITNFNSKVLTQTLPKAQRTRGLSSSFQSNLLGHITSSCVGIIVGAFGAALVVRFHRVTFQGLLHTILYLP